MNEGRNVVPKGVYNCKLMGASRSGKSNHAEHFILSLRLQPTDCGVENPCEYFAEIPLVFKAGAEFGFYNRDLKMNEKRKCTTADTAAAWEYARKCIPAWAEYCDTMAEELTGADAVKWFDGDHSDVIVRAAIKDPREYNGKFYYEATVYEWHSGKAVIENADDFNAEFGKMLKAAGMKFGGKATATAAPTAPAVTPKQPKPPAPKVKPSAPTPTAAKVYTSEDAWDAYEAGGMIKNDPQGAKYWGEVEKIVGKPMADYEKFTSEDWRKCVEKFAMPF